MEMKEGREGGEVSISKMGIWLCSCNYCPTCRVRLWWAMYSMEALY